MGGVRVASLQRLGHGEQVVDGVVSEVGPAGVGRGAGGGDDEGGDALLLLHIAEVGTPVWGEHDWREEPLLRQVPDDDSGARRRPDLLVLAQHQPEVAVIAGPGQVPHRVEHRQHLRLHVGDAPTVQLFVGAAQLEQVVGGRHDLDVAVTDHPGPRRISRLDNG